MMSSVSKFTIANRLRGFATAQDGVSAVEFAMLLPLLITLYLGTVEVTQAVSADRKMTLVSGTVGDLVARASCVTTGDITTIFNAGQAVVYPFSTTQMRIVVSSVIIGSDQSARITSTNGGWSQAYNGGTVRNGDVTSFIPATLRSTPGSVIWAEAYYTYIPTIGKVIAPSGISMSETIFLKPRLTDPILLKSSC